MAETEKLVAAILAAARCRAMKGEHEPEVYIAEYEKLLGLLETRNQAVDEERAESNIGTWEKSRRP
jgi:hypothetical protein